MFDATQVAATTFYWSTNPAYPPYPTIGSFRYSASATSNEWEGKLSQATVFDYALSQSQITYLYNSGTPQNPYGYIWTTSIAYYPLGGSSLPGSSSLTEPFLTNQCQDATVFDFPSGGADLINCGNKVDFTNAFTLSSWVKTDTTAASYIFYKMLHLL